MKEKLVRIALLRGMVIFQVGGDSPLTICTPLIPGSSGQPLVSPVPVAVVFSKKRNGRWDHRFFWSVVRALEFRHIDDAIRRHRGLISLVIT